MTTRFLVVALTTKLLGHWPDDWYAAWFHFYRVLAFSALFF